MGGDKTLSATTTAAAAGHGPPRFVSPRGNSSVPRSQVRWTRLRRRGTRSAAEITNYALIKPSNHTLPRYTPQLSCKEKKVNMTRICTFLPPPPPPPASSNRPTPSHTIPCSAVQIRPRTTLKPTPSHTYTYTKYFIFIFLVVAAHESWSASYVCMCVTNRM